MAVQTTFNKFFEQNSRFKFFGEKLEPRKQIIKIGRIYTVFKNQWFKQFLNENHLNLIIKFKFKHFLI